MSVYLFRLAALLLFVPRPNKRKCVVKLFSLYITSKYLPACLQWLLTRDVVIYYVCLYRAGLRLASGLRVRWLVVLLYVASRPLLALVLLYNTQ